MPNTPEGMPERELLAEYAHETWSGWMKWMFGKSMNLSNGEVVIPANLVQRWKRQMCTPYANLEEYEKGSDRAEADKILELLPASHVSALQERVEKAEALVRGLRCHGFECLEEEYGGIPKGEYVFNLMLPVKLTNAKSIEEMQTFLAAFTQENP